MTDRGHCAKQTERYLMISSLSHIAILVPSARKAADFLANHKFEIGEEEIFEETKEIYIQGNAHNPLLLMEAKETGSYRRALEKRGPGVHHIAIDVLSLEGYLDSLSGSGWLLHLNSLKTIKNLKTAYLARPGFPALIEIQEKKKLTEGPLFVEKVFLPFDSSLTNLVKSIGLNDVLHRSNSGAALTIQGRTIQLRELY
jgi:hypothetical protein